MKTIVKGDLLILMPENGAEAAALARWRDGRDGCQIELLPNTGPGATLRIVSLSETAEANSRCLPGNGEPTDPPPAG